MASEDPLICQICQERWVEQKRLDCGHDVCLPCLSQLLNGRDHVRCPFCKAVQPIAPGKEADLPSIYFGDVKCGGCGDASRADRFGWCMECARLLCRPCQAQNKHLDLKHYPATPFHDLVCIKATNRVLKNLSRELEERFGLDGDEKVVATTGALKPEDAVAIATNVLDMAGKRPEVKESYACVSSRAKERPSECKYTGQSGPLGPDSAPATKAPSSDVRLTSSYLPPHRRHLQPPSQPPSSFRTVVLRRTTVAPPSYASNQRYEHYMPPSQSHPSTSTSQWPRSMLKPTVPPGHFIGAGDENKRLFNRLLNQLLMSPRNYKPPPPLQPNSNSPKSVMIWALMQGLLALPPFAHVLRNVYVVEPGSIIFVLSILLENGSPELTTQALQHLETQLSPTHRPEPDNNLSRCLEGLLKALHFSFLRMTRQKENSKAWSHITRLFADLPDLTNTLVTFYIPVSYQNWSLHTAWNDRVITYGNHGSPAILAIHICWYHKSNWTIKDTLPGPLNTNFRTSAKNRSNYRLWTGVLRRQWKSGDWDYTPFFASDANVWTEVDKTGQPLNLTIKDIDAGEKEDGVYSAPCLLFYLRSDLSPPEQRPTLPPLA